MSSSAGEKKYKGVRRRKWGKWVSEIRVPGSQERLWLGSYSSPEAAAVAHDIAYYCLRRGDSSSSGKRYNFPLGSLPTGVLRPDLSPKSVQRAASDAGMAVDAQLILQNSTLEEASGRRLMGGSSGCGSEMSPETSWGGDHGGGSWGEEDVLDLSVEDYL
ncbi:Ethylene-responsive transcription factor ERF020 [Linum grandiflorum]